MTPFAQRSRIHCFAFILAAVTAVQAVDLMERTPFDVPLAKLSLSFDDETHRLNSVRVSFNRDNEFVTITHWHDEHIKMTRKGRVKTVHRESPEAAYQMSEFEAEYFRRVTESLVEALEQLEKDLHRERWGKCLHLDSYLPKFLRGYYFLCEAVRNSHGGLPRVARVPESAFDVSLNSPKSDARLKAWRSKPEQIIKLRIMAKELAYQLEEWLKNEKKKRKKNPGWFFSSSLKKAYSLFIRVYFNLTPAPHHVPDEDAHL